MGLITGILLYDIADKAASIESQIKEPYSDEEEAALGYAVLIGGFATVFWPFAMAWPLALRRNPWCFGYLATGAVILILSPFNYLATGILFGLAWTFVFCWWIQNPQHVRPMTNWYFDSKPRTAQPVQMELPL